ERHRGNQALAAREHTAVLRRNFGQNRDRFFDRFRRVIGERRGLHRPRLLRLPWMLATELPVSQRARRWPTLRAEVTRLDALHPGFLHVAPCLRERALGIDAAAGVLDHI